MTSGSPESATHARGKRALVLAVAVVAAGLDLAAKAVSEARLAQSTVDLGVLQLRLGYNAGVAFSMGDRLPDAVIVAVTALISALLITYAWRRAPYAGRVERVAGGAVIGGALANVVDRAGDGVVTDYLHTGWWPTFNLADTFLVTGLVVVVAAQVWSDRTASRGREPVTADTTAGHVEPLDQHPGAGPHAGDTATAAVLRPAPVGDSPPRPSAGEDPHP